MHYKHILKTLKKHKIKISLLLIISTILTTFALTQQASSPQQVAQAYDTKKSAQNSTADEITNIVQDITKAVKADIPSVDQTRETPQTQNGASTPATPNALVPETTANNIIATSDTIAKSLPSTPVNQPVKLPIPPIPKQPSTSSNRTPLALNGSSSSQIRALEHYQNTLGMYVSDTVMTFAQIPDNSGQGAGLGVDMSNRLKEYARYKVTPIMIAEATTTLANFGSKDFFAGVDTYFATMKAQGVTDNMLGVWIPFPEANMPMAPTRIEPALFATLTNSYMSILRKYFPNAQTGLLLDSKTYDRGDDEFITGKTVSLSPYLSGITKGSVNVYMMQGFPWLSPSNPARDLIDPNVIFPVTQANEAANILGVNQLWFNTGIMSAQTNGRTYSALEQGKFLTNMANHMRNMQTQTGKSILLNQFAENKIGNEGKNWNLINSGNATEIGQRVAVQKAFITQLYGSNIRYSVHDKR
jgi:hypothetical protein